MRPRWPAHGLSRKGGVEELQDIEARQEAPPRFSHAEGQSPTASRSRCGAGAGSPNAFSATLSGKTRGKVKPTVTTVAYRRRKHREDREKAIAGKW